MTNPFQSAVGTATKSVDSTVKGMAGGQPTDPELQQWYTQFSQKYAGQVPKDVNQAGQMYNLQAIRQAENSIKSPQDLEKFKAQGQTQQQSVNPTAQSLFGGLM
jgi:hypothetical protein